MASRYRDDIALKSVGCATLESAIDVNTVISSYDGAGAAVIVNTVMSVITVILVTNGL
jgi:hypothetical protein